MRHLLSTPLVVLVLAVFARADTVELTNGSKLEGRILRVTESEVVIDVDGMGEMTMPRARVARIARDDGSAEEPGTDDPPESTPSPTAAPAHRPGPAAEVLEAFVAALSGDQRVPSDLLKETLAKLAPLGRGATSDLADALSTSKDWRVRLLAVKALRALRNAAAVPALIHAVGDPFKGMIPTGDGKSRPGWPVRDEALAGIAELGARAYRPLLSTAANRSHADQALAVFVLGELDVSGEAAVLVRLARDTSQAKPVRQTAVLALGAHRGEATRVLADLVADRKVGGEAVAALQKSLDPAAVEPLMAHVRRAGRDYEAAKKSAWLIGTINRNWSPADTKDCVDYLLFFPPGDRIEKLLGLKALPRLKYWAASSNRQMKKAAKEALAAY